MPLDDSGSRNAPKNKTAGYVLHGRPRSLGAALLISGGPLLINTVLCALLTLAVAYQHFVLDAGLLGILAPSSLYGVCAGLTYRLPVSKKSQIELGPEGDFYFLGSDLPDGVVIWQFRLQGGFRVDL